MDSLNKVAQQWINSASGSQNKEAENGVADCDLKKRKVVWTVNNFKGTQNKVLELCLSFT
jgi:hypothetical protein